MPGTDTTKRHAIPTNGVVNAAVFSIPVKSDMAFSKVRIVLDGATYPGWNCIDAVGLKRANGQVEWARSARASSSHNGLTSAPSQQSWWRWP